LVGGLSATGMIGKDELLFSIFDFKSLQSEQCLQIVTGLCGKGNGKLLISLSS
jgi:hypothetical protein